MRIKIDGLLEDVEQGMNLAELIGERNEDTIELIVELNYRFVHRRDYASTRLKEGDRVELIHPAFGG